MSNLILESKIYNLSTRGSSGNILNDDTNFKSQIEYNIPDMIVRDDSIEYIQFSIPYAVIPISFNQVDYYNNTLNILENNIMRSFIFPSGNYNASTFASQFKKLLGTQWTINLNNFNSIFTITNTLNQFTIYKSSNISSVMGFSTDLNSSLVNNINTLILTRCCNFFSLPRICLRSSQLITNNNMIGSKSGSDLIISIPNNSKPNGQISYQNISNIKLLYKGNNISRLVISLTDDDNNLINFNGVSSFFTIQFDIYRLFIPKLPTFQNIVNHVNSSNTFNPEEDIIEM